MRKLLMVLFVTSSITNYAQELPKNYNALIKEVEPQLISWRRHFHENPELSNRVFKNFTQFGS